MFISHWFNEFAKFLPISKVCEAGTQGASRELNKKTCFFVRQILKKLALTTDHLDTASPSNLISDTPDRLDSNKIVATNSGGALEAAVLRIFQLLSIGLL